MRDAARWGLLEEYVDFRGDTQRVDPLAAEAVLDALEADGSSPPEAVAIVTRAGEAIDTSDYVEIETEDDGSAAVTGGLPPDLPFGYHRLVARDKSTRPLILSPGRCFLPDDLRTWGWAAQLYSVRSKQSWGHGDLGDLASLGRWAAHEGAGALLLNPLHAPAPGPGQQPSPYFPSSRCFRDPLYLRVEGIDGGRAQGRVEAATTAGRSLNESTTIDRDAVYALKRAALQELFDARAGFDDFESYRSEQGSLLTDFSTFMALHEEFGGWPGLWPQGYERPDSPAVTAWRNDNAERVTFHAWVQWQLDRQLGDAGRTIDLIHDLSIGVDGGGADVWRWQDVFARSATMGAPPDEFNTAGQNWGMPPFDPWKLQAASYEPFIRTIRAGMRHAAGLRIDHVMWMFRVYWIPEGNEPARGAYVRYPYEDLLNILALESHRAGAYVIGEDLGTVEDVVRKEMTERRMMSYRLLWFEDELPHRYPSGALAAVTNHDLPTIPGLWSGEDLQEQHEIGLAPDDTAFEAMRDTLRDRADLDDDAPEEAAVEGAYRLLAQAPCRLLLATLEDAALVRRRPNIPGTTVERPNWSVALPLTIEQLRKDPLADRIARTLGERRVDPELRVDPRARLHHRFATLPGLRMHYVEAGSGPLVVLLHGFPDFWYSWRHQIPALARAGLRVVAPDMRGYNLSDKPAAISDYSIEHLTDDVAALIEDLGETRAALVGHDWGGFVAWFFAMRHPDMLDKLAVLNMPHPATLGRGGLNPRQWLKSWYIMFFQLPFVPELATSLAGFSALRRFYQEDATPGAFSEEDIELYLEAARRSDRLRYPINYYRAALRRNPLGLRAQLRPIEAPVQVIWGDRDAHIEPSLAEPPPRWVPNLELHRLEGATHWVHMDEPQTVSSLLTGFLSP